MPLDIVIFKQGKEKEYVSIDEKLHQLIFSQDAIKQGRCRELSKIEDYYLTDVIFMGVQRCFASLISISLTNARSNAIPMR